MVEYISLNNVKECFESGCSDEEILCKFPTLFKISLIRWRAYFDRKSDQEIALIPGKEFSGTRDFYRRFWKH